MSQTEKTDPRICYEKPVTVLLSHADHTARLGLAQTFSLFMDIATDHAALLGAGAWDLLPKGFFWLTVKTKIRFERRPKLMEKVRLLTWPEVPVRLRANRSYELRGGEEVLVRGKTEWAVLNTANQRLVPPAEFFPEGLSFFEDSALPEPFRKSEETYPDPLENGESVIAEYTVTSADIDLGRHMNNAAYVRAFLSCFSTQEQEKAGLSGMEIHFKIPCYEGERLRLQKSESPETSVKGAYRFLKENGQTAALIWAE